MQYGLGSEVEPPSKRLRASGEVGLNSALGFVDDQIMEAEYFFEQRFVGWIVGKGGASIKHVEDAYQVRLVVDQTTKDEGYSKLRINGLASRVEQAAEHVNGSLTKAASLPGQPPSDGPFLLSQPPLTIPDADPWYEARAFDPKFIGWLIGKGGGVIRDVEQQTGCSIGIDQSMKHLGRAKAELRGEQTQRAEAARLLQESLEKAGGTLLPWDEAEGAAESANLGDNLPADTAAVLDKIGGVKGLTDLLSGLEALSPLLEAAKGARSGSAGDLGSLTTLLKNLGEGNGDKRSSRGESEDIRIEQRWVGWVLGKGGGVLREIETAVGVRIRIDQTTKHLGYSTVVVQDATREKQQQARDMLSDLLQKAGGSLLTNSAQHSKARDKLARNSQSSVGRPSPAPKHDAFAPVASTMELEQRWVGWVLGKGGQVLKEIEQATGAMVSIDQTTKHLGYSTVSMTGTAHQVAHVQDLLDEKLKAVVGSGHADEQVGVGLKGGRMNTHAAVSRTLEIEQRWVGWIVGRGGQAVKDMEASTGAVIAINQTTKELGYSTLTVTGTASAVEAVEGRIQASLAAAAAGGRDLVGKPGLVGDQFNF